MKTIRVNYFRDYRDEVGRPTDVGGWCYAAWVDEEYDSSDPLPLTPDASDEQAAEAARQLYAHHRDADIVVCRVGNT